MLSGHNTYWMWGPGHASDRTVLVADTLGQLRPYFARCRLLTTYHAPYHVQNDWTTIQIGVCTAPVHNSVVLFFASPGVAFPATVEILSDAGGVLARYREFSDLE